MSGTEYTARRPVRTTARRLTRNRVLVVSVPAIPINVPIVYLPPQIAAPALSQTFLQSLILLSIPTICLRNTSVNCPFTRNLSLYHRASAAWVDLEAVAVALATPLCIGAGPTEIPAGEHLIGRIVDKHQFTG